MEESVLLIDRMGSDCVFFHGVKHDPPPVPSQVRARPRRVVASSSDVDAHEFFWFLFSKAGLNLDAYRGKALNRRIPACMRFLKVRSLEEAHERLSDKPELLAPTLTVALLGVTDFCRDPSVFAHLRDLVLPQFRNAEIPLRVWSAACSDGRELYSVAILLKQAGLLSPSYLLGTDCRADAIRLARIGRYPADSVSGLHGSWLDHFARGHTSVHISREIRDQVCWMKADLLQRVEPGPWDLILWRNMAIYLQTDSARKIWRRLVAQLAPGGFIITGRADYAPSELDLHKVAPCIYQKRCPIPNL